MSIAKISGLCVLLLLVSACSVHATIGCHNANGEPVDWYVRKTLINQRQLKQQIAMERLPIASKSWWSA